MLVEGVHLGPFVFGPNTLWLGLHGFLLFIILMFAALLFGAVFSTKRTGRHDGAAAEDLRRMIGALLPLMISGIIPDWFRPDRSAQYSLPGARSSGYMACAISTASGPAWASTCSSSSA